jgi:Ser/Thr protein kinase RdoA (MazF antagonist)
MTRMREAQVDLEAISGEFRLGGPLLDAELLRSGHIHDTYAIRIQAGIETRRYLFQRINTTVFRNLERLTENVLRVTEHLRAKIAAAPPAAHCLEVLSVIPTQQGEAIFRDPSDAAWRGYNFIENARTVDVVENADQARKGAEAFGRFQQMLVDLPKPRLHETIPHFHDTPWRFEVFGGTVEADPHNRAAEAREEIAFAFAREDMTGALTQGLASGELPERITHNDTKINNVLFDTSTGDAVCVIDLDTVMPGAAGYDFGDLVRTTTSTATEDERDLRKVELRLDLFEAIARGFLEAAREFLTPAEVDSLVCAGTLITFETGLRFLTDFLQGDVYFKTARPAQNLDRARTQFELVRQLEEHQPQLRTIVERYSA